MTRRRPAWRARLSERKLERPVPPTDTVLNRSFPCLNMRAAPATEDVHSADSYRG